MSGPLSTGPHNTPPSNSPPMQTIHCPPPLIVWTSHWPPVHSIAFEGSIDHAQKCLLGIALPIAV